MPMKAIVFLVLISLVSVISATTIIVPLRADGGYLSDVNAAISNATSGDIIELSTGTWGDCSEAITMSKSMTIRGQAGHAFNSGATDIIVRIERLTVTGAHVAFHMMHRASFYLSNITVQSSHIAAVSRYATMFECDGCNVYNNDQAMYVNGSHVNLVNIHIEKNGKNMSTLMMVDSDVDIIGAIVNNGGDDGGAPVLYLLNSQLRCKACDIIDNVGSAIIESMNDVPRELCFTTTAFALNRANSLMMITRVNMSLVGETKFLDNAVTSCLIDVTDSTVASVAVEGEDTAYFGHNSGSFLIRALGTHINFSDVNIESNAMTVFALTDKSTLNMIQSSVINNTLGVFALSSDMTMNHVIFASNSQGAIFSVGDQDHMSLLSLVDTDFIENGDESHGVISCHYSHLTLIRSDIHDNLGPAVISMLSTGHIEGSVFRCQNNMSALQLLDMKQFNMTMCSVTAGGIIADNSYLLITNTTIRNVSWPSALELSRSNVSMSFVTLHDNDGDDEVISASDSTVITMHNCHVNYNPMRMAIALRTESYLYASGCFFHHNGGGVSAVESSVALDDCHLYRNILYGAVSVVSHGNHELSMIHTNITHNVALGADAIVYCSGCNATITLGFINSNIASSNSTVMTTTADVIMSNVSIENNTAIYGGGITIIKSHITMVGCSIMYNSAQLGGGVYVISSRLVLNDTVISDNDGYGAVCDGGGSVVQYGTSEIVSNTPGQSDGCTPRHHDDGHHDNGVWWYIGGVVVVTMGAAAVIGVIKIKKPKKSFAPLLTDADLADEVAANNVA